MEQILTTFGIDWHLLLINAVNFGLLLAALWYFLYGPVMKMLEERRQRVVQGVRDAETATHRLSEIERSRAEVLARAGKEADSVLSTARTAGAAKERELLQKGEAAAAVVLRDAAAEAAEMKARSIAEKIGRAACR